MPDGYLGGLTMPPTYQAPSVEVRTTLDGRKAQGTEPNRFPTTQLPTIQLRGIGDTYYSTDDATRMPLAPTFTTGVPTTNVQEQNTPLANLTNQYGGYNPAYDATVGSGGGPLQQPPQKTPLQELTEQYGGMNVAYGLTMPVDPQIKTTPVVGEPARQDVPTSEAPVDGQQNEYFPSLQFATAVDAAALARNIAQGAPPTLQLSRTSMPRVRFDYSIFDEQRRQVDEGANRQMDNLRSQLGSAADVMQTSLAMGAQQLQAKERIDTAQRQQEVQEDLTNQQLAAQEQATQDAQDDANAKLNYDIQARGQQAKDMVVSRQLSNLKQDALNIEQAQRTFKDRERQLAMDEEYKNQMMDVQKSTLELARAQSYRMRPDYQEGLANAKTQHMNDASVAALEALQGNEAFDASITEYSESARMQAIDQANEVAYLRDNTQREIDDIQYKVQQQQELLDAIPEEQVEDRQKAQETLTTLTGSLTSLQEAMTTHEQTYNELESKAKSYEMLYKEIAKQYDIQGAASSYDEQYRQERGILSEDDILKDIFN